MKETPIRNGDAKAASFSLLSPRTNVHVIALIDKNSEPQQQPSSNTGRSMTSSSTLPLNSSNYHSLQSIVSSDSRDEEESDLSKELNLLDQEETEEVEEAICLGRSHSGGEESHQSKTSINRLRSTHASLSSNPGLTQQKEVMAPPPPPTTPPPPSSFRKNQNKKHQIPSSDNVSSSGSSEYEHFNNRKSHKLSTNASSSLCSSSSASQKKALISLLKEMRALEQMLQQQSDKHASERSTFMSSLEQQSKYIDQLEHKQQALENQNIVMRKQLGGILTKLDRFASGCRKFNSASVKKMSEALHVQVREWGKSYSIDNSCLQEIHEIEQTTMEKMQGMQLEIKQLRAKNHELKDRIIKEQAQGMKKFMSHTSRKRPGNLTGAASGDDSTGISRQTTNDDKVAYLPGITQMAATAALTSTTKLVDAMPGCLSKQGQSIKPRQHNPQQQQQQCHRKHGISIIMNANHHQESPSLPLMINNNSPYKGKALQIASLQSIVKQVPEYDQRVSIENKVDMLEQQQVKQMPLVHPKVQVSPQKPSHPTGLPKSPIRGSNMNRATPRLFSRKNIHNTALSPSMHCSNLGFSNFKEMSPGGFTNFDTTNIGVFAKVDDFGGHNFVDKETKMWPTSWGGGDDKESEV